MTNRQKSCFCDRLCRVNFATFMPKVIEDVKRNLDKISNGIWLPLIKTIIHINAIVIDFHTTQFMAFTKKTYFWLVLRPKPSKTCIRRNRVKISNGIWLPLIIGVILIKTIIIYFDNTGFMDFVTKKRIFNSCQLYSVQSHQRRQEESR